MSPGSGSVVCESVLNAEKPFPICQSPISLPAFLWAQTANIPHHDGISAPAVSIILSGHTPGAAVWKYSSSLSDPILFPEPSLCFASTFPTWDLAIATIDSREPFALVTDLVAVLCARG